MIGMNDMVMTKIKLNVLEDYTIKNKRMYELISKYYQKKIKFAIHNIANIDLYPDIIIRGIDIFTHEDIYRPLSANIHVLSV